MYKRLCIVCILVLPLFSIAQHVKGTVYCGQSNIPLEGVHIYISNSKKGATTNEKGKFEIKLDKADSSAKTISFSFLGYHRKELLLNEIKNNTLQIFLTPSKEKLDVVSISSELRLKRRLKYENIQGMKKSLFAFGADLVHNKIYVAGGDFSLETDSYITTFRLNPIYANMLSSFNDFLNDTRFTPKNNKGHDGTLSYYDLAKNEWTTVLPNKLRKRAYHRMLHHENRLYVIGGKNLSSNKKFEYLDPKIEIIDLKNKTITVDHTNPHQAVNPIAFVYNNRIIMMGGVSKIRKNGTKIFSDKIHSYNLKSGLWYEIGNLPFLNNAKGILIGDSVFLIEIDEDQKTPPKLYTFNLISGDWKHLGDLPKEIKNPSITYDNQDHVYFHENEALYTLNFHDLRLLKYTMSLSYTSSSMFYKDNELYILGGYKENDFSKTPSSIFLKIDLGELKKTRAKTLTIW